MRVLLASVVDGAARSVLETAVLVAKRFDSHIVGLNAIPLDVFVAIGGHGGFLTESEFCHPLERDPHKRRAMARALFSAFMREHDFPLVSAVRGKRSAEWREEGGLQAEVVGRLGRVVDALIVEKPSGLGSPAMAVLEGALFGSGRPVLMTSQVSPASIGDFITIIWDGAPSTARAVAFAMPFLKQARCVEILNIEGSVPPGFRAEDLCRSLALHRIPISTHEVHNRGRSSAKVLLEKAGATRANLLIKGIATADGFQRFVYRDATRRLIMQTKVPLFLAS